ncbi:hypothetical protein R1flu_008203 [Riccia fluitans]|uniref:Uncharacterized protein n=1 Tax=Riccia fluitans TaxID=41844 RepID=A0ABD1YB90_9MARC
MGLISALPLDQKALSFSAYHHAAASRSVLKSGLPQPVLIQRPSIKTMWNNLATKCQSFRTLNWHSVETSKLKPKRPYCFNRWKRAEGRKRYRPEGEGPQQQESIKGGGMKALTGNEAEIIAPGKVLKVKAS